MAERGVPEALDVEHFAQARIQELEFLDAAVAAVSSKGSGDSGGAMGSDGRPSSAPSGGLRDQAQGLPRHMRRRTTSHKPRRMPVALKNKDSAGKTTTTTTTTTTIITTAINNSGGKSDTSGTRKKRQGAVPPSALPGARINAQVGGDGVGVEARRCRKHRRRPTALLKMHCPHAARGEGEGEDGVDECVRAGRGGDAGKKHSPPRWLETHIWHAKRMHMKEAWGFILPAESNRGPRAATEAASKHCTLQDMTFLRPLELLGPRRDILGVLSALTDPLDARATGQRDCGCVDGFVEARTHLYRVNEFPLGCIAPVSVLWSPSDAVDTSPATTETWGKGRESPGDDGQEEEDDDDVRRVWVWVHPAASREALREVRRACALEGAPWRGSVQAGPVQGGLCRLRVRGRRSQEILQQVLRTESAAAAAAVASPPAPETSAAPGDHFEIAARRNAARWRALASTAEKMNGGGTDGGGGGGGADGPRSLPPGSVLALTALDPREQGRSQQQQQQQQRAKAHRIPPAPASSRSTGTPDTTEVTTTQNAGGGGGRGDKQVSAGSFNQQQSSTATTTEEWPPRWAAVSPLWDPDARALSAKLAATRPDHVINEARRRERAQGAWEGDTAGSSSRASAKENSSVGAGHVGGSDGGGGAAPVILVSASGVETTTHGEPAATAATAAGAELFHGNRGGGGGGGGGGKGAGKEAEKKIRAIASGWDLILPPGWAPVFFRALVMAGARVISLKDADGLALEAGEARFPADYPDTVAGRRHWDEIGRVSEEAWAKTRPKHRGFKRRPRPPTLKAAACREAAAAAAAAAAEDNGIAAGGTSVREGMDTGQEGPEQQSKPSMEGEPAVSSSPWSLSQFRPDFRSIAAGVGFVEGASTAGTDGGDAAPQGLEREREPYAVARGFQYVRAFLPEEGEDGPAAPAAGDSEERSGRTDFSLPSHLLSLPPIRLAFPTVVELTISLDKGVPKPGAPIYPASLEHHALWIQGRRDGKPWSGFSLANRPSPLRSPLSPSPAGTTAAASTGDGSVSGEEASGGSWPALPATIGAVTSGGFSLVRGGGRGRAVCEAVAIRDAFALSVACCGRQRGGGRGLGRRPRRPWALVLVGNEAGGWVRPAAAVVAAS
eukprot:g11592.t1